MRCGVGFAFPREIEVAATEAASGDCVLVGVSRAGISLAAALVFGLPLGLMLAFAAVVQALWGAAFAGAAAGLVGGGALALLLARRAGLDDWVDPVLVEIRGQRMPSGGGIRAVAGEREGTPLAKREPSAGEREGTPLARKEPSAGEREGTPLAKRKPSGGGTAPTADA